MTGLLTLTLLLLQTAGSTNANNTTGYITGAIFAVILLIYLLFSLIKPEKF